MKCLIGRIIKRVQRLITRSHPPTGDVYVRIHVNQPVVKEGLYLTHPNPDRAKVKVHSNLTNFLYNY